MRGSIDQLKKRYERIQARYTVLDKKDDKGRSIYTHSKILSQLAEEFCYREQTILKILLMNIPNWYEKHKPKEVNSTQSELFN